MSTHSWSWIELKNYWSLSLLKITDLCHCKNLLICVTVKMYQFIPYCEKCCSPNYEMSMKFTQNPELVFVNKNQRCFALSILYILKFLNKLYIPAVNYIFLHVFNKMYPGWLDAGAHQATWGKVSRYAPGAIISPFLKGGTRASALASPLRVTVSAQLTRCICKHSCQNRSCIIGVSCGDVPVMKGI